MAQERLQRMKVNGHVPRELSRVYARDQGTNLRIMMRRYV
jgi:hypothetical protein